MEIILVGSVVRVACRQHRVLQTVIVMPACLTPRLPPLLSLPPTPPAPPTPPPVPSPPSYSSVLDT
ncbi:hypothetical protein E2C01_060985 [Portunus trituberculatus]|uniref:Uncharacterized protein n=1 Tax=Portunus trituberculatus TaxID=210409 RepID=A0A5B7H417_PORTR|nr:hypothetical protein [Portunus trituberculatus]